MEASRDGRPTVKCFTCPRERRGEEAGWYYVDVPDRARAYGPPRIYACPRHYRHFAERERGRWITLDPPVIAEAAGQAPVLTEAPVLADAPVLAEAPALVAASSQTPGWVDANPGLELSGTNGDPAVAALGLIDTLASDS